MCLVVSWHQTLQTASASSYFRCTNTHDSMCQRKGVQYRILSGKLINQSCNHHYLFSLLFLPLEEIEHFARVLGSNDGSAVNGSRDSCVFRSKAC